MEINDEEKTKIKNLEETLGKWFKHTYHDRASVALLYEKGTEIENKIYDICEEFEEIDNFVDLKEAFEFIDGLHDSSTREYNALHKEEIYYYMRRLL